MSFFTGPMAIPRRSPTSGCCSSSPGRAIEEGRRFLTGRRRTIVYALSLAVYCTSWTYYGSVGVASERGLDFLPIYIGPILVVGFAYRLIERVAKLAREQNLTTVADFVSARYGKSQAVAAIAALIALMASAPYIALQLKAITETVLMVIAAFDHGRLTPVSPPPLFPLVVAALLALFAMAFGTRRLNPTEHQHGLILAIAAEFAGQARRLPRRRRLRGLGSLRWFERIVGARRQRADRRVHLDAPDPVNWIVTTLLSASAILLLPRQFHVSIVECEDNSDIRAAATLFPLYLVADQPVCRAARHRRAGVVSRRRHRPRPDRARAAALRGRARHCADNDDRRHFRGDRHGRGRQRRAGDHRFQRPRHADPARDSAPAPSNAAAGEIGLHVLAIRRGAILFVLTIGYLYERFARRRRARRHRSPVVRRDCADPAGIPRQRCSGGAAPRAAPRRA